MKLTNLDQALLAVIEIAVKETGKTKAADAIKANEGRIETTTETHSAKLYKTPTGTPVFKATTLANNQETSLTGFKLLQKAANLEGHVGGGHGSSSSTGVGQLPIADSAQRNRSVGLMRRKSG
jgi:hypothetical protein